MTLRSLLAAAAAALLLPAGAAAQSSFETDPFASRFRERPRIDLKFRVPEAGGDIGIRVSDGAGGRQTLLSENVYEVQAPRGGTVTVEYQDLKLTADYVRADRKLKTIVAEGDVVLEQGATRLTGSRLELDLTDKLGVLTDGQADLEGGIHLKGALLAKVGPKTFTITDGTLTSCEGDKPSWAFAVKSGNVTLEGYARLKEVVFRMGRVPLLYTPYLVWPALQDRASGFLVPGVGYSSSRGAFLGLSYFLVLGRSADATFSLDLYTKQYFGLGMELRARPSEGTFFEGLGQVVRDTDADAWQWKTLGILVSDDLAPKTRGVLSWLHYSDLDFFQRYDRDFNLTSTRTMKTGGFVTRNADPLSLNLRLERQEAFYGASTVVSDRKPVLEARLRPMPLLGQRMFFEASAQAGFLGMDRGAGQPSGSYDRFDLFPKLSVPLSPLPWLSADANAGARVTTYGKSLSEDGRDLVAERYTRTYGELGVQMAGPTFSKIFEGGLGAFTKVKHVIEPRFDYVYLPDPAERSRTPLFDEVDSVFPLHTLRYALVQRLLGKEKTGYAKDFASLELSRAYTFSFPAGTSGSASSQLSKHGPLDATLRVNASARLNFDARASYDFRASQLTSTSLSAAVSGTTWNALVSYFDSRPVGASQGSAQVRLSAGLPIIPRRLRLDTQASYDITRSKALESRSLVTYEGSCFKVLGEYRYIATGTTITRDYRIGLNLKNIGSFLDFSGNLNF